MEDAHYVMYAADAARRAGLSRAETPQPEVSKAPQAVGKENKIKGKGIGSDGRRREVSVHLRTW